MNANLDHQAAEPRPRRPLLGLALTFVVGLAVAPALPDGGWAAAGVVAGALLLAAVAFRRRGVGLFPIFGSALLCGALHGALARPGVAPCDLHTAMERDAEYLRLTGRIADAPVLSPSPRGGAEWRFMMAVEALHRVDNDWRRSRGLVSVRIAPTPGIAEPRYGDRVELTGSVRRANGVLRMTGTPASFRRLAPGGSAGRHAALAFRAAAARAIGRGIEEHDPRETAIVRALTLGMREHIPLETRENFLLTGTMHVFAISGLHVGIVAAFGVAALRTLGVPRRWQAAGLAPLLALYVAATGWAPSAQRAAVMALAYTAAPMFGRRPDVHSALAFAAIALLVADAGQLRDVGFLYSFVVVGGLLGFGPALARPIRRALATDDASAIPPSRWARWARSAARAAALLAAMSVAAWLASAPLQARFAYRFAPAGLLGNLLAVPAAFLIVMTGGLSMAVGALHAAGAETLNHANRVFAGMLADLMGALAALPGAHRNVPAPSVPVLLGVYAALAGLFALRGRPRRTLAGSVIAVLAAAAVHSATDRRITVHALSDDLGSAALIEGPRAATVLVDAGPRHRAPALIRYLRARGINRIAALVLTRADADAAGGAPEIARRFAVERVYYPASASARSTVFTSVLDELRSRGVPIEPLGRGERRTLRDGAEIEAYHPDPSQRYPRAAEAALVARWGRADAAVLFGLPGTAAAPRTALERADSDAAAPLAIISLRRASAGIADANIRRQEMEETLRARVRLRWLVFQGSRTETVEALTEDKTGAVRLDANQADVVRVVMGAPPGVAAPASVLIAVVGADSE